VVCVPCKPGERLVAQREDAVAPEAAHEQPLEAWPEGLTDTCGKGSIAARLVRDEVGEQDVPQRALQQAVVGGGILSYGLEDRRSNRAPRRSDERLGVHHLVASEIAPDNAHGRTEIAGEQDGPPRIAVGGAVRLPVGSRRRLGHRAVCSSH
jgi:hypothetical protein